MNGWKRKLVFVICIIGCGACLGFLGYHFMSQKQKEQVYENLQEEVVKQPEEQPQEKEEPTPVEIPVDFQALWDVNPEIYAWIEIPGTDIAYPVVQSASDDAYYLDHTIEGYAGYPGSIYTESKNQKDFSDFDTVIYGHDMDDGSMFAGLHQYSDEQFYNDHTQILIYTPEHIYTYRVFTTVTYDDRHILNTFDFTDMGQRQEYLDSIGNTDAEVTIDSKILTLSTCIATMPDNRFLVEAVLVNEQ